MAAQSSIGSQLSQAFIKVADECTRLDDIPAFNQGAAILQAIEQIQRQIQQMQEQIHGLDQTIEQGFDGFKKRNSILNINAIARTQNLLIGFADKELCTLVNAYTGENIQGFPDTAAMIDRMGSAVVNRILLALDLNTNGSLDERRTRMSVAIGLEVSDV